MIYTHIYVKAHTTLTYRDLFTLNSGNMKTEQRMSTCTLVTDTSRERIRYILQHRILKQKLLQSTYCIISVYFPQVFSR